MILSRCIQGSCGVGPVHSIAAPRPRHPTLKSDEKLSCKPAIDPISSPPLPLEETCPVTGSTEQWVNTARPSITTATVIVASTDQISSELAGEAVILDLKRGVYHGLDPTGARIWTLLQQRRPVGEIRDTILAEY